MTRARSWIAACWKAIRTGSSKAWPSRRLPWAPRHGFIYVRAEYPLAVKRVRTAIAKAERLGVLGNNIFNTPFSFDVKVRLGAGAFVCGEETALIASIEGRVALLGHGRPFRRNSDCGVIPTLINNVETFANIPPIIRKGGKWFAGIGTEKSKGTKVFALAGRVNNTGLIEVPMGTTLRDIVFDIGGGIPEGQKFKAVQTGGPSGGCIPEQFLDMPVDYESLAKVGSIMGSGGMIVMDETSCMVDVAKFFMEFCMSESCGKCVPCRVGTTQIYNLLGKNHQRTRKARGHRHARRTGGSRQEHQPVRPGPDRAQSGDEHPALFPG